MNRDDLVLAALAPANGTSFTPVQVQKLFFILDRKAAEAIGGPHFNFTPYDYGPFDANVYRALESLEGEGYVSVSQRGSMKVFQLTPSGQKRGEAALSSTDAKTRDYIQRVSDFVRRLSFNDLVKAVYKEFPEMKANSIFRD